MKSLICAGILCLLCAFSGCRSEDEASKELIERISFDKESVNVKINGVEEVRVTVLPETAKFNERIMYTPVEKGYVEIDQATNNGFIVKGLKRGNTIIKAESASGRASEYLRVTVNGEDANAQYITVSQPVVEVKKGELKTVTAGLYGGNALDNNDFVWRIENGKNNIGLNVTGNIAVISGLEQGYQKITISHPKADYDNGIMVFVNDDEQAVKYISSQSNVVRVANDGQYHDFLMLLINGAPEDAVNFVYTSIEGADNIEIVANGNVCNVRGIKSGLSMIRITHPLAAVEFDMRIVVYDVDIPYIVLDQSFLLLNAGESANVNATVEFAINGILHQNEFSYKIFENDIEVANDASLIEVVQNNNHFFIRARRSGTARVVISNVQAEMSREILVVVRDEIVYLDDYYITTTQNVIQTQIGDNPVRLNVRLVNGTTADANMFEWEVDDGTVVNIESGNGITRGNRAAVSSIFEAAAMITPKKVGTAKITVFHEKSKANVTVMVKVYPKGTFTGSAVNVGMKNPDGSQKGLETVIIGTPKTLTLSMITGDITKVGTLRWEMEDTGIASINTGAAGMTNILQGNGNGLTKMKVDGVELQNPYECLILAGDADFISNASVIHVDSIYKRLLRYQTVNVIVNDTNDRYKQSDEWEVSVTDRTLLYAVMVKNTLMLQGKEAGETEVVIRHPGAINDITLKVIIEPDFVNVDQPYYISAPEIVGVVRGTPKIINALIKDSEIETGNLEWSVEDSSVLNILGTGGSCQVTGRVSGKQTKVWVKHKKNKAPEKFIIVYVIEHENDLKKIVLGTAKENYLIMTGQDQLITLITNATDKDKKNINWVVKKSNPKEDNDADRDVITLEEHYDSAMMRAHAAGNAEIEVSFTPYVNEENILIEAILPLTIYVSVVDTLSDEKVIRGPAIVELVRGDSKLLAVDHLNLTQSEVNGIGWSVLPENDAIANITGNGDTAHIYGVKKGAGTVKIKQNMLGYEHNATLVVANTQAELESMYVMGIDQSYHTMMVGEEKKLRLTFGGSGFPETAKTNLVWTAGSSGVVRVVGRGESVTIVAENIGSGTVTVKDTNMPEPVSFNDELKIEFLVTGAGDDTYEFRGHDKMVGIVIGERKPVTMTLYDRQGNSVTNYAQWDHVIENENAGIISVNRAENILDIRAETVGQEYIKVRYRNGANVVAEARILVYTAMTHDELDAYYPILVEKSNYLIQIGETARIKIETMESKDDENFRDVSWGIENASVIESEDTRGKKEFTIKGRSEGQCVISVNYKNKTVTRIFVTVVSNEIIDMTKYIVTENIIGMVKNDIYTAKIFSNLGNAVTGVLWESLDTNIVTVSGSGGQAALRAINEGEAYVTVSYGSWLKRHILVYVCAAKPEAEGYAAMNMDNQYYRAGIGETFMLPLFFAPNKSDVATMWVDKYENKVVSFKEQENGSKVEVTTLNEGVAVLEAYNTGLSNPGRVLRIYIEAAKKYNNAPKPDVVRYLTVNKTVYVMNPEEKDVTLNLTVSGVGYTLDEMAGINWRLTGTGDSSLVTHFPNGKNCEVRVNQQGKEGTATLEASLSDNAVEIKIIVSKTGLMGFPHIIGPETVRVGLKGKVEVEYEIAEIDAYDPNYFTVGYAGSAASVIDAVFAGNVLKIEGKASGQAKLYINCEKYVGRQMRKEVNVIVTATADGLMYLTTRDNFTTVKVDEVKTIAVDLAGFEDTAGSGYRWDFANESDRDYLELSWTGKQAQIKGKEAGMGRTIKLTVSHALLADTPMFNLNMYVRVSNNYFNPVYITTSKNIVSVTRGRSVYLDAELVNGQPGESGGLQWRHAGESDKELVDITGVGTQAVVVGKEVGIARVTVSYALAVNQSLDLLVIVEEDNTLENIYITTDTTLVEMMPGNTREIVARLTMGDEIDNNYGWEWKIDEFFSYEKDVNNRDRQVVDIVGGNAQRNRVFINGMAEGEATVTVSHIKSRNSLPIKIYVRQVSTVSFGRENLTLDQGKYTTVSVEIPPNTTVTYSATQYRDASGVYKDVVSLEPKGLTSSKFLTITGINPGVCVVSVSAVNRVMSDEMIVEVKAVGNKLIQYISTSDVIYNMTDWQSASNRALIRGLPVGEKVNGQQFSDEDSMNIMWEIKSGKEYIGFNDSFMNINAEPVKGKMVNVFTRRAGTAEIELTHDEMQGYKKSIYVEVHPYDANFQVNPMFMTMQAGGDDQIFEAKIQNIEERYDLVVWTACNNEKNEQGIEITESTTDGKQNIINNGIVTGQKVKVRAFKDGVYKLKASFNGATPLEVIVYVEPKKSLEIMEESFITMLPEELRFVGIKVEPEGSVIRANADYNEFVTVDYAGPIYNKNADGNIVWVYDDNPNHATRKPTTTPQTANGWSKFAIKKEVDHRDRYTGQIKKFPLRQMFIDGDWENKLKTLYPGANAVLALYSTDRDGYTHIKLVSNSIERMITVNTNHNYTFYMDGYYKGNNSGSYQKSRAVRGKPDERITVKYNIQQEKSVIEMVPGSHLQYTDGLSSGNIIAENVIIDRLAQTVTFTLKNCGYAQLQFTSEYNEEAGIRMIIPVYVYYDRIELNWTGNVRSASSDWGADGLKSRVDILDNVIYIADHEVMAVYFQNNGNYDEPVNYKGQKIIVNSVSLGGTKLTEKTVKLGNNENTDSNQYYPKQDPNKNVQVRFNNSSPQENAVFLIRSGEAVLGGAAALTDTADSMINIGYVDVLTVNYSYFNGGEKPASFDKKFVVYKETWIRKRS
jgi:hypothetical protein